MTDHPKRTTAAILITILAGFLVAGMDGLGKALMADQPPLQVVWGRYFFHAVIMAVILAAPSMRNSDWSFLRPRKPKLQAFRAVCLLGVTVSMYTALAVVPLADATAVLFFAPVLLTLLAGVVLNEQVGWRRLSAVAVGFAGVLLIVRPGFGNVAPELIFAFLAACFLAVYMLVTKQLSGKDDERTTLFYTTAPGAVLLTLALPWFWADLSGQAWLMMFACGALGAAGHYLLVQAFHLEDAGTLSPFLNAHLVAAMLYSLVFFGDPLTPTFFAGTTLIVGSGLFIWWRERRRKVAKA